MPPASTQPLSQSFMSNGSHSTQYPQPPIQQFSMQQPLIQQPPIQQQLIQQPPIQQPLIQQQQQQTSLSTTNHLFSNQTNLTTPATYSINNQLSNTTNNAINFTSNQIGPPLSSITARNHQIGPRPTMPVTPLPPSNQPFPTQTFPPNASQAPLTNNNFNNSYQTGPPLLQTPFLAPPPSGSPPSSFNGPPTGPLQTNFNRPLATPTLNQGPPLTNGPPLTASNNFNPPPPIGPGQGPPTVQQQPIVNQFNRLSLTQQQTQPQQPQPQQLQQQPPQQQLQHNQHSQPLSQSQLSRGQPQAVDLLREKRLISPYTDESDNPTRPIFPHEFYTQVNCHADTIRCTLTAIPESQSLLNKLRLPLGILIHPFKDLESLKVVQSTTIVRCRSCRSYINPFVLFLDNSKWRCNMCYSLNDLPDEFLFDPVTKSYGDPSKRPEINSSTIEFIAPAEYTVSGHFFIFSVSFKIVQTLFGFAGTLFKKIKYAYGVCLLRTSNRTLTKNNFIYTPFVDLDVYLLL